MSKIRVERHNIYTIAKLDEYTGWMMLEDYLFLFMNVFFPIYLYIHS